MASVLRVVRSLVVASPLPTRTFLRGAASGSWQPPPRQTRQRKKYSAMRKTQQQNGICPVASFFSTESVASEATGNQSEDLSISQDKEQLSELTGEGSTYEFQAETRRLLDIVAKSLYSDREVFVRELVSNASDALERRRRSELTGQLDQAETTSLEVHLTTDRHDNTLTIQDNGVGMTKEELVKNLGTIAHSGSKAFVDKLGTSGEGQEVIGQFGVGFYSAFMVSNQVDVFTRPPDAALGHKWTSDGLGSYQVAEVAGGEVGTKVVLHLKPESREFSSEDVIKGIVMKYSNFIGFPIFLNGTRHNTVQALWMEDAKSIGEQQHEDFYRFLSRAQGRPRYTLLYRADAPVNIRSIFYVPEEKPTVFDLSREAGSSVSLYSRKVLVQSKATDILPHWLRFLHGVVDSEDIPLNLSRELLQQNTLIRKLRDVLERRLVKFLLEQMRKDPEKFDTFYDDYGVYIREGVVTTAEQEVKEDVARLLRFESSALEPGQRTTLMEYVGRMQSSARHIHYLCAPSRVLAQTSPYFEAVRRKDIEVLFCYDQFDELVLLRLDQFLRNKLVSVETDIAVDHFKEEKFEHLMPESERLAEKDAEELMSWIKTVLADKITNVKVTARLDRHPAMVTVLEMGAARHFLRTQALGRTAGERAQMLQPTLEINPGHTLIKKLNELKTRDPELARLLVEQICDNAMMAAGLTEDPRPMVSRLNELLTQAFKDR
uniref:TNF receptor-associated protein 1 n=1 Tax=Eptatretus burgeri TaxID=7764 RepID=A0A8C4NAI9_EPTBU